MVNARQQLGDNLMPLPRISNWDSTRTQLHQAVHILRAVRLPNVATLPNYLAHSTWPTLSGASSGPLDFGGVLDFDYINARFVYHRDGVEVFSIPLAGYHQTSLAEAVFAAFAQAGHRFEPRRDNISHTDPFMLDPVDARAYAEIQWRMAGVLARVKSHMFGIQSPLVVWSHGFDLSSVWFARGMDESKDPHLNMGFSPGTPDVGQPYFYFYTHPAVDGLREAMPDSVSWQTGWSAPGGAIKYEHFADAPDPEMVVLPTLVDIYRHASARLIAQQG
jgi:hypothetical protein